LNRRFPHPSRTFARRGVRTVSSLRSKTYFALLFPLAVAALVAGSMLSFNHVGAQGGRLRIEQDLQQVFTRHEDVTLDTRAFAAEVRHQGRASLRTASNDFLMQLQPNDLRAANYRAEAVEDDGKTYVLPPSAVNTYKGSVEGVWGSDARFTIKDDKIEGMILMPSESYFVEPAAKYSAAASSSDYIVYRASDLRSDIVRTCADPLGEQVTLNANKFMSSATTGVSAAVFSPLKQVEIATEADFDYVSAHGGPNQANSDIISVMNGVDAIYKRDIGLTFKIVFQHTWDTAADPYNTSGDPVGMIKEFQNYWNATFGNTARDVTHLWTGRNMGGPNGLAYQGVVCADPASAYGMSDNETITPFTVTIPAHEIGHNFGAAHCDGQAGCDNSIMVSTQTQANTSTFCQFSIDQITAFVNANSSCLSDAAASNPIDDPTFFVRQHYLDFLNRTADQSGLNFWVNNITSCGNNPGCVEGKRIDTSAAFFFSIEFQETGYLIERTYKTAFGDDTNRSMLGGTAHNLSVPTVRFTEFLNDLQFLGRGLVVGQAGWEQQLESNKVNYFNSFVQSNRFTSKYPSTMPPATYVATLNSNAGNPLSATELATLTAEHSTGQKSRAQVLRQIAEHPNLARSEFNRAFVLMQFFGYLRRDPNAPPDSDYTGYEFWLTKLNQFNGDYKAAEMVKAFLSATEYRKRFGTP
jgi:Metallo-peptidase family M12/Reprolysin family propeptide